MVVVVAAVFTQTWLRLPWQRTFWFSGFGHLDRAMLLFDAFYIEVFMNLTRRNAKSSCFPEKKTKMPNASFNLLHPTLLINFCLTPTGASPLASPPVKRSPSLSSWEMLDLDEERQSGIAPVDPSVGRTS